MQRFHYLPTDSRTFCGTPTGARINGTGEWEEFVRQYRSGAPDICPECLRMLRRWQRFAPAILQVDRELRDEAEGE